MASASELQEVLVGDVDPTTKPCAFVSMLTTDDFLDAALVMAKSLRDTKTKHHLIMMVDENDVSEEVRRRLKPSFDVVLPVKAIHGIAAGNLSMIGRLDLATSFTKIYLWSFTKYYRIMYLDADTLICKSLDQVFSLPPEVEFAASPELGFPDCFNAGVMVVRPNMDRYNQLIEATRTVASFDGGDQGLMNLFWGDGTNGHPYNNDLGAEFKADWNAPQKNWYRLSFMYNMEMHKVYRMYIPAVLRYRNEHKVLHFIGLDKPWHFKDGHVDVPDDASVYFKFYAEMVQKWWSVYRSLGDVKTA